jgi:hypothetical protein
MLTGIKVGLAFLALVAAFYGIVFLIAHSLFEGRGYVAAVLVYGGGLALFLSFFGLVGAAFGL